MPLITLFGIYWQALKLWCKGLPYQPYPAELKIMSRTLEHLPQTALNGTLIERKCRDACIKLMNELRYGHLEIWESGHCHHFGDPLDTAHSQSRYPGSISLGRRGAPGRYGRC